MQGGSVGRLPEGPRGCLTVYVPPIALRAPEAASLWRRAKGLDQWGARCPACPPHGAQSQNAQSLWIASMSVHASCCSQLPSLRVESVRAQTSIERFNRCVLFVVLAVLQAARRLLLRRRSKHRRSHSHHSCGAAQNTDALTATTAKNRPGRKATGARHACAYLPSSHRCSAAGR